MGRSGIKISQVEADKIMELHEKGLTPREMSSAVGRSANAIYLDLKARGVKFKYKPPAHSKHFPLAEEIDYTRVPDHVLFNYKQFPSF